MPRITRIVHKPERQRYWVYIDGEYCCSVRERTFPALGLHVGRDMNCAQVQDLERFHWKNQYGPASWEKEKVRLDKVADFLRGISPRLEVATLGFGTGSTEYLARHPAEAGVPDLQVRGNPGGALLCTVEVSGTERMRGGDYWVRPDKLAYARQHPEVADWIVLHFALPEERMVFIRPDLGKQYACVEKNIRGSGERYVIFAQNSPEIWPRERFAAWLRAAAENTRRETP